MLASYIISGGHGRYKYPSKFVALVVIRLPATETAFIHQFRQLLLLQFLDHVNGLFEAILAGTRDVQVKRGVLGANMLVLWEWTQEWFERTEGVAMFLSGR